MLLGLLAVLALMAAACGGSSDDGDGGGTDDTQVETGEARVGGDATILGPEVRSLDPALVINSTTQGASLINAIYDTLYTINTETDAIEPRLATDFTSDDGITWTMTLRAGVTFSDGTPFNAEAVRINWQRTKDNARGGEQRADVPGGEHGGTQRHDVRGDAQPGEPAVLARRSPSTRWPGSLRPLPSRRPVRTSVTTPTWPGPARSRSRPAPRASETTLVRNDTYWQEGLPKLDSFTFRPVADQQQVADTVVTGGADASFWVGQHLADEAVESGMRQVQVERPPGRHQPAVQPEQAAVRQREGARGRRRRPSTSTRCSSRCSSAATTR